MSSHPDVLHGRLGACLLELGISPTARRRGGWSLELPSQRRGTIGVGLQAHERTVRLTSFVMRAPDRNHEGVYRRLLERNLEMAYWRYGVDRFGDIVLAARLDGDRLSAATLDEVLGLLITYIDEAFESLARLGFDIPDGIRIGAPPAGPVMPPS